MCRAPSRSRPRTASTSGVRTASRRADRHGVPAARARLPVVQPPDDRRPRDRPTRRLSLVAGLPSAILLGSPQKSEYAYTPPRFFSATGDSITAGHVGTANTTSFLEQLKIQYAALGEYVDIDNRGISGETTAQIAARSPSSFAQDYAPLNFRREFLVINGGKNDNAGVVTPAQAYANLASISVAAQALGVQSVMTTAHYSTPGAMSPYLYTWVDALNVLIRANSCGADYVVDYYVDPILANPTTTYWPDEIHPGNVALAAMSTVIRSVLG